MKTIYTLLFSILIIPVLLAQVPHTISYQGVLTDNSGNPKPDGDYTFTFRFYESSSGGHAVWSETKTLNISKGLFSTSLGDQTAFDSKVKFDKPYYLGIKVGDEEELFPRIALTSSGYSITSDNSLEITDGKMIGGSDDPRVVQTIINTNNTLNIANPNGPTTTINVRVPLTLNGRVSIPNYVFTSNAFGTGGGILGTSTDGEGIFGKSNNGIGIHGESIIQSGVFGKSTSNPGVYGESDDLYGVFGFSSSSTGVFGQSNSWNGVQGFSNNGIGIYGESIEFPGVWGTSQNLMGVFGYTQSQFQFAVLGQNANTPDHFGALGGVVLPSGFGIGVYGAAPDNSMEWAGLFEGNVNIAGNCWITESLIVGGEKFFQIDHPSDPENKYLVHSCVESPERMNIYNGNVITDGSGSAIIELPGYFEILNIDYRYQLTVIGQFAQAIVESKIQNNRFTIKTDKPNVEVSWQVTGVRNDPYAKTHPMIVEKEKTEIEQGKYIHPELFGKPEEMGVHYVKIVKPEMKPQLRPELYKYEKQEGMRYENE